MKVILLILLIFSSGIFSKDAGEAIPNMTWDISGLPENVPLKLVGKLFFVHQYHLDVAFGRVNDYLCLFRTTQYKNFSNLEDEVGSPVGYKAILDNNACQNGEPSLPWLVVSKQATSSDNLVMEMSMPNNLADPRLKLTLEEETSLANPYGVLNLDYKYVSMGTTNSEGVLNFPRFGPMNTPLYNTTYKSSLVGSDQVQYEAAVYIDGMLLTDATAGQISFFYGTKILHNKNSGGHGTVTEFIFNSALGNFPAGPPFKVTTTNFAYNNNVVKYETITGVGVDAGQKNQIYNADTSALEASSPGTELCVSRTSTWKFVPSKRYGVYNSSGNRISFSTNDPTQTQTASYNYSNPEGNILWDGKIKIFSTSWVGTALQCKKIADGTPFGNTICPGTSLEAANPTEQIVRINGEDYQNFPLFDVPEGTVLTIDNPGNPAIDGYDDGNEYYVRQLGDAKVYPARPQGDAECDSLTIQLSKVTPDHKFFNYPVVTTPRTGAVLVNRLTAITDLYSPTQGSYYSKDGDQDNDGVPNYLDAFPTDDQKSLDNAIPFQQDWTNYKYLEIDMYSNYVN